MIKRLLFVLFTVVVSLQAFAQQKDAPQTDADKKKLARLNALHKHNKAVAESDKQWIGLEIAKLTSHEMHGRGYVKNGRDSAGIYILERFKEMKLKPVAANGAYAQGFAFPVNTFPGAMRLKMGKKEMTPGEDFIIDAGSPSYKAEDLKINRVDLARVHDTAEWAAVVRAFVPDHAYYLRNVPTLCKDVLEIRPGEFSALLPKGCFIIPQEKLTWTVSRDTIPATVFYVKEDALPKKYKKLSADDSAAYLPHAHSENIMACVPGAVKDTFIVFTAHYDHLGMMGDSTVFPGASDNASGVAMLLYLARYYTLHHPPHYSVMFIAFAGEEAGLMGSEFYTANPLVPLKQIKFLTNIDIMGDATDGITVVNATQFPHQFELLKEINDVEKYVPAIISRGTAANSDHYYFTNAGVPSFFIYSDGGQGFYHDVYDKANTLSLNNVVNVAHLLTDFAKAIHVADLMGDTTSATDTTHALMNTPEQPEGGNPGEEKPKTEEPSPTPAETPPPADPGKEPK